LRTFLATDVDVIGHHPGDLEHYYHKYGLRWDEVWYVRLLMM